MKLQLGLVFVAIAFVALVCFARQRWGRQGRLNADRRWTMALALVLASLIAATIPGFHASAVAAIETGKPKAAAGDTQAFAASTANRNPVGGPPQQAAMNSARSEGRNNQALPARSRNSRTYKDGRGYVTEIYPGAVNYQTPNGSWLPIDNTLVGTNLKGFSFQNKANSYALYLPRDIGARPVRFAVTSGYLEFSLIGAVGKGSVFDDTATYRKVLPGVDINYRAQNEGVKETLTLGSLLSPHSFSYLLQMSPGLLAQANSSRGIDFVDPNGMVQFSFAAPFMYESGAPDATVGPATFRLGGSPNHQIVTLALDEAWLANPARHWPVVVDPTITYGTVGSAVWKQFNGANQDCYLKNGSFASTNFCNGASLYAGYSGGTVARALLQFNVQSAIPQDVTVLDADMAAYLYASASGSPVSVDAMQLTQAWTTAATWNTYDGSHLWTNAGGTFASPAAWTNSSVGATSGWYHWYLAKLVQGWIYGTVGNNGILLRTTNEATTNQLSFRSSEYSDSAFWPFLKVTYQLGIGDKPSDQSVGQKLNDRLNLQVDLSSGNLLIKHHEQSVRGVGLNQSVDLYYNNLSPAIWDFGRSWEVNTGWDIWLATSHPDGVNYYGSSGTAWHYIKNSDGSYTSPPGLDATLIRNGDQTYTLTFNASQEKFNFSSDGLSLLSDVDRNGNQMTFHYNATGSLASITDTEGRVTTFSYVAASGCTPPTSDGFVRQMTDPTGRTFQYGYANCNLTTLTDAANKTTTFGYDANFNLNKITDPNGNVTNLGYDGATRVTSITRVTNVSLGTGPTTIYAYNTGQGSCAAAPPGDSLYGYTVATDPNNHSATYCYDQQGLVLQTIDPLSHSASGSYTSDQHEASSTDALSQTTTATYNSNNDLTKITPPILGSGHTAASSSLSFQTPSSVKGYLYLASSQTDSQGHCTAFVYDASGNLTDSYSGQATPCDGLTGGTHTSNRFQGDPGISCGAKPGELCSTNDAAGSTTSYGYNANGDVVSATPPAPLGAITYTVDSLSRQTSMTDGKAQKTGYSFDGLDRVTQILYNGANTYVPSSGNCISYVYDANGNRTSMVDNTGTTTYYYDPLNRLTTEAIPDTSAYCAGSSPAGLTYSYDPAGNLTQSCDVGGVVTYAYDAANRLSSIAEPGGNCGPTPSLCTTFGYNNNAQRTLTTFPGGSTLAFAYDANWNVMSAVGKDRNGSVLSSFSYTYSTGSTDTRVRQTLSEADAVANNTYTYSYDAFNRLTQASVTGGTGTSYTYSYDGKGNVVRKTAGAVTTSYAYNAANELCWSYLGTSSNTCSSAPTGATTYSFDADGNETGSSTGGSFAYNPKNQTTAITYGGATLSGLNYSGEGQAIRTAAGSTNFDSGPYGLQLAGTGGSNTYYLRDNAGTLIGERIGVNHYYYLTDALGSIAAVITGDGLTVGDRYGYDAYGNTTYHSGTIANPWGFAGGYTDATGLIKFGTRYYDPTTARWTQVDPLSVPGAACAYTYAGDNPVNNTDPSGQFCASAFAKFLYYISIASMFFVTASYFLGQGLWPLAVLMWILASYFASQAWYWWNKAWSGWFWTWWC